MDYGQRIEEEFIMMKLPRMNLVPSQGRKHRSRYSAYHKIIFASAAVLIFAAAERSFAAARNVDIRSHRGFVSYPAGRLTATIYWHGKGPYRGHVIGHVHYVGDIHSKDETKCAVGQALEDGKVVDLGTVCKPGSVAVKHAFNGKGQVLVRVCGKTSERGPTRNCSRWK
jgi:hypothetical protein